MQQFKDRLAKYVVGNLFYDYTHVEVGVDLLPNTFYADLLLIPDEPLPEVPGAGLLTRLTQDARCLIEPFSGTIETERLEATLAKLRLALHKIYDDKLGADPPHGVLWLVTTYWPRGGIERLFGSDGETIEPGLVRWQGFYRETVYMVNSTVIPLRDDTVLFRLLGKGEHRKQAVVKIFKEHLEPYVTLLNNFDLRFKEMAQSEQIHQIDPEELKNLVDLRDTREEVLRELAKQELRHEIAQKMLELGEPVEKIASITGLSPDEIQKLQ